MAEQSGGTPAKKTAAKKAPAKKTAAKKTTASDKGGLSAVPDPFDANPAQDTDLADVARAGLDDVPETEGGATPAQGAFEGMDYTKIRFVGVNYDTIEMSPKIGDRLDFLVGGKVVEVGDKALKDGHIQHIVKVDVDHVAPAPDA